MKFHHFWPTLKKCFWLPLKKYAIAPPNGKSPSGAHVTSAQHSDGSQFPFAY